MSRRASGLLGSYYPAWRGGWRSVVWAAVIMAGAVVLGALAFGEDRGQVIAQSCVYLVLVVVLTVQRRRRRPHTTITADGLEVLPTAWSRPRRASWDEVREVRAAAPLRLSGDVLLATGEEVLLVGMTQADVQRLADLLSALRQPPA